MFRSTTTIIEREIRVAYIHWREGGEKSLRQLMKSSGTALHLAGLWLASQGTGASRCFRSPAHLETRCGFWLNYLLQYYT